MDNFRTFAAPPKAKTVKPWQVSLYGTRDQLDPGTYTPDLAQKLSPWSRDTGLLTSAVSNRAAALDANSGIFDQLDRQAQADLALGGDLNAEEARAATQGARAAFGARGLNSSPQGILGEVMRRAAASNARRRERQGFAASVEDLRQKRVASGGELSGILGNLSNMSTAQAENMRQFELERSDALRFNDKRAAVDMKIGNSNAAAGASAAKSAATGQAVAAGASVAVAAAAIF